LSECRTSPSDNFTAKEDPGAAEFVKLRFFAGFTTEEAAQALGVHERTARRHWKFARGWLYAELRSDLAERSDSHYRGFGRISCPVFDAGSA